MKPVFFLLVWAFAPLLLSGQSGFAETYGATTGFGGKMITNTAYGYKVYTDKISPDPNTFTRMTFETGADGTYWGVTGYTDFPQPAGTLLDVALNGDYVTAETFATPTGIALRIRRWFPFIPGYYNNLAEINFPDVNSVNLERLVFRDQFPGGVFLAGHYRTLAEPGVPVAFVVRSDNFSYNWWIHTLIDIPPGSFAFARLTAFSDGGCAVVFKRNDENKYIERLSATGASLWRRQVGWLTTTVSSLTEGPGNVAFYTLQTAPFSGPSATYGNAVAVAPDGTVVFDKDLNALLGQYSVFPHYILPLPSGESVVAGHESPVFPGAASFFFIAKLDATGQLIWKKNYYYFQNASTFYFAKTTPDNGYIFTGIFNDKVFLFKIDQNGVGDPAVQYCPAAADQPWHEWIAKVKIGSIQNTSGKTPYSNFTALSTDLGIGQAAAIELTAGYSYYTYDQYFGVWIDYNHDNVFGGDEMAVQAILSRPPDGTLTKTLATNLSVPASALPGPTRMRVIMQRGAYSGPCDNPSFGEVEDYTVDLKTVGAAPDLRLPNWELIHANNCFTNPGQAMGFLGGLVLNEGPASAGPFSVKAWLSPDAQFGNANDVLWQTIPLAGIGPNGGSNYTISVNITDPVPPTMPPGIYHIFIKADADNTVTELNESNNLFEFSQMQIGAPNYSLQNLSGVPASLPTGGSLNFSYEINNGNSFPLAGLTGGVEVTAFLSADNIPNNGNDALVGMQAVGFNEFNAAGVVAKTASMSLPGAVTAGNYFLILTVQPTAYCDQNYQNNTLVGPQITVMGQPSGTYCAASGNFPWHDWIAGVALANVTNNNNGKSQYTDYTGLTANLTANTNTPVTLTAGFSWTTYAEYWKIWIDYDHDGLFEEPGEVALQQILPKPADGTPTAALNGSITVPASAAGGPTRMRVAMRRGAYPGPCETFPFGEVEDYGVNITPSFQKVGARAVTAAPDFDLFPNPAGTEVFLAAPEGAGVVAVKMFDQNGRLIREAFFENTGSEALSIPLDGVQNGVYWLQIVPSDGRTVSKKLVVMR